VGLDFFLASVLPDIPKDVPPRTRLFLLLLAVLIVQHCDRGREREQVGCH